MMSSESNYYQRLVSFDDRRAAADKLMTKRPDHIPVVLLTSSGNGRVQLKRHKLLVSRNQPVSMFMQGLRAYAINRQVSPYEAIYAFSESRELLLGSMLMSHVYQTYKNADGHLYVYVEVENTFGYHHHSWII